MSVFKSIARIGPRFCLGLYLVPLAVHGQPELTLSESERLALEGAPWLQHHRQLADAAAARVTYERRLPDPELRLGAVNVPTDTYRLDQEEMTMLAVGVRQQFPAGDTLSLRAQRATQDLSRQRAEVEMERRALVRQIRQRWLDLYYASRAVHLLNQSRALAKRQLEAAERRYRAAIDKPQAVLGARISLARLNEREPMLNAEIARLRAELGRWIGDAAGWAIPPDLPGLPPPTPTFDVTGHPEWLAAQARTDGTRTDVELARQAYKPAWAIDLSYGFRQPMPDGTRRADLVSAAVAVSLPIFAETRQDQRFAERQMLAAGARFALEDKRRELESRYEVARSEHDALQQRVAIETEQLLPAVRRASEITSSGFARDTVERREARMQVLDADLSLLRLRVDLAKSQAALLYFTGE
jgi:outer membrane protein TolC